MNIINGKKINEAVRSKKEKKINKSTIIKVIISIISIIFIIIICCFIFKFKNITLELGEKLNPKEFININCFNNKVKELTDYNKLELNKLGKSNVFFSFFGIKYKLSLTIIDTTSPNITLKNVSKMLGYNIDVNDFIVDSSDQQKFTVDIEKKPNTNKYGEYSINVIAQDESGNISKNTAKLYIGWAVNEYNLEYGEKLSKNNLLYDIDFDSNAINDDDISKINEKNIGTYYIGTTKNGVTKKIKIIVKDTLGPTLELKDKVIYIGNSNIDTNEFINVSKDASGKVTVKLLTKIDYSKLGDQEIKISSKDIYGNETIKNCKLSIIEDKVGPAISGLSTLTINKNQGIDYTTGVSAYDDNDGPCEFTHTTINTSQYGTYAIIYKSTDKKGNVTESKRIVNINHNLADTNAKIVSIAQSLSDNVEQIRNYVRTISYSTNYGGSDPIWFGLINRHGNCYVHALIFDALLKQKGYETKLIWVTDKSHYWNMVFLNGKWVHMDSTPTSRHTVYSIMNDEQRLECLQGRTWDRSQWPEAN